MKEPAPKLMGVVREVPMTDPRRPSGARGWPAPAPEGGELELQGELRIGMGVGMGRDLQEGERAGMGMDGLGGVAGVESSRGALLDSRRP